MTLRIWISLFVFASHFTAFSTSHAQVDHVRPESSHVISKHDGSKDDIEAIGNRKVGKGRWGNWYSFEKEVALGRQYSNAILHTAKLVDDQRLTEYVDRLGQNIVRNSDAKVAFTIRVIDSEEINAFALPGGFLYVNSALLLAAQDEAELAAVMAHEIAHVAARHATRQMTRSEFIQLASIPLVFWGGALGAAVRETADIAAPLTLTKFSRNFESEADYLGVQYLYKSGYDPHAFITFFERIQAHEIAKQGIITRLFADHPQTSSRLHKIQLEIARLLPAQESYLLSTSDFAEMQARLSEIQRRPKITVRNNSVCSKDTTVCDDGDRPKLKRRQSDETTHD